MSASQKTYGWKCILVITGILVGALLGALLVPVISAVIRNLSMAAPAGEVPANAPLFVRLKSFFSQESYEHQVAQKRIETLQSVQKEQDALLAKDEMIDAQKGVVRLSITNAMALTVRDLASKPVKPAGPTNVWQPSLIVPPYEQPKPANP